MGNFVNDERKYEDTMPIGEFPPELHSKTIKNTRLKKKRGKFKMKKIRKIFIIAFFMMIAIFPMKAKADTLMVPIAVNKEYNYKSLVSQYGYEPNGGLRSFRLQFTLQEPGRVRFYIKNIDKPEQKDLYVSGISTSDMRLCLKPYTEYIDSLYVSLDAGEYSFKLPTLTANNNTVLIVQFEAANSNAFIEREPNSSFDTANLITLNQKYEGDVLVVKSPIKGYSDQDYYKIQLDEGGKISFTTQNYVTYKPGAEGSFIIFSEDEYGNIVEIAKQSIDTTGTETESMHLRLPTGIYYFSVQGNYEYGWSDTYENNINYSFKINYTAESSETHEEEFNDYSSQANQKEVNQPYIGNISNAEDKDCFRFKITQLSICSMVLSIPRQTSWDTFRAELYEDTMDNPAIQTISNDSNPRLESEPLILQPGTYYVRLKGGGGYVPSKSAKIDYSFTFQQEPYYELEEVNIPFSKTMKKGDSFQFEAEYIPENATYQDVEWETSDSSIVKIDDEGLAYAVSEGTAIITATSKTYKDIFAECEVIVTDDIGQPVECTITFESNGGDAVASKRVVKGSVFGELPVLKREGYIFKGWYTSSNGGTKITPSRKVTGNVTIYAQWTKQADQPQGTQEIQLNKKSSSVVVGKTVRLQLKGATGKIAWKTSNKKIASVSGEGIVKTKRIGTVTVTANHGGKKYNCKITVKPLFKKVWLAVASNGGYYFRVHSVKGRRMTVSIHMFNMTRKKLKAVIKADGKTATVKFKCKNGRIHKLTMKASANGNKVKVIETAMCRKKLLSWKEVDKKKKISQTFYPASHFRDGWGFN
ncbi:Ig-like domain-containing protein [Lachnospiraceae bacterium 48-42]